MTWCFICKNNGEDDAVCASHNPTSYSKCCYHSRHPAATRKQPKADADSDSEVEPELRTALPRTPNKSLASVARSGSSSSPSDLSGILPKQLIKKLYDGELTKQAVKAELTSRVPDADGPAADKLLKTIAAVDLYSPSDLEKSEDVTAAAKAVQQLQSKHGKLLGTYMATHKHVLNELHVDKPDSTKTVYELSSGERVVEATKPHDIESSAIFLKVLVDFTYLCAAYAYLTATESYYILKWATHRLYLNGSEHLLCHRTIIRILRFADTDHTVNLRDIVDDKARMFWSEEQDNLAKQRKPTKPPTDEGGERVRRTYSITPGDPSLAVPFPRKGICFEWTNGMPCTSLVNGKCRFAAHHSKCGKQYKDSTGATVWCDVNHRAKDCPHKG